MTEVTANEKRARGEDGSPLAGLWSRRAAKARIGPDCMVSGRRSPGVQERRSAGHPSGRQAGPHLHR